MTDVSKFTIVPIEQVGCLGPESPSGHSFQMGLRGKVLWCMRCGRQVKVIVEEKP